MRKHKSILIMLLSSLLLFTAPLDAKPKKNKKAKETVGEESPDKLTAKSWVQDLREENKLKSAATGLFPARVLFVGDIPQKGNPEFVDIDVEEFDKIGFLKGASKKELEYFFSLNKKTKKTQGNEPIASRSADVWLTILLDASEADSVLWMHKNKDWQLFQLRDGKPQVVVSRPGTDNDAKDVHKWLIAALGYEGVVIDKRDNLFLVGNLVNLTKKDTQALLLKNSANKFSMATAKKEGGGLLQLTNHYDGFAIFELLLGDRPESVPVGTKIAIEKSKTRKARKSKKPKSSSTPDTPSNETTETSEPNGAE